MAVLFMHPHMLIATFISMACTAEISASPLSRMDLRLSELAVNSMGSHGLFKSYQVDGPVRWSRNWPWKLDLSGVAWDRSNTATAITARHVVMAAHYIRGPGERIVFHDRSGKPHFHTILRVVKLSEHGIQCDVAVGLLDRPLTDSISSYPLPAVREDGGAALIGATALVTEQKRELYFHRIAYAGGNGLRMRFDETFPPARRKPLVKGDSGHPSFVLCKGELVLVETHTTGGAGAGPYYGSSAIQQALRKVVRQLDAGYTIRTTEFDTPTLADAEAGRKAVLSVPKPPAADTAPRVAPAQGPAAPLHEPRLCRPRVVPPPA